VAIEPRIRSIALLPGEQDVAVMAARRQLLLGRAVFIRLGPSVLAPVTIGVAIARLGVGGYAKVVVAIAVAQMLSQLAELGLNQLIIREIHRGVAPRSVVRAALALKLALIVASALVLLAFAWAAHIPREQLVFYCVVLLGVWSATIGAVPDAALIAIGAITQSNRANLLSSLATAGLPLLSLFVAPSPRNYLLSLVLAGLIYTASSGFLLARQPLWNAPNTQTIGWLAFTHATRWFAANSLTEPLYSRLDSIIVAWMAGPSALAVYTVAYRLFSLMWTASHLLALMHMSRMRRGARDRPSERHMALTGFTVGLSFVALSYPLALMLLPTSLRADGFRAGILLAVASAFVLTNQLFLTECRVLDRERRATGFIVAALVLNAALNLALDGPLGAVGAALSMVTAELLLVFIARWQRGDGSVAPLAWAAGLVAVAAATWAIGPSLMASGVLAALAAGLSVIFWRPLTELLTYNAVNEVATVPAARITEDFFEPVPHQM
jgi:O-antigen/teichoic acid export membrane protein